VVRTAYDDDQGCNRPCNIIGPQVPGSIIREGTTNDLFHLAVVKVDTRSEHAFARMYHKVRVCKKLSNSESQAESQPSRVAVPKHLIF
jgi:hypothetical protein